MGIELDLLNHDVVKQLVIDAFMMGWKYEGEEIHDNNEIISLMRKANGEEKDIEE